MSVLLFPDHSVEIILVLYFGAKIINIKNKWHNIPNSATQSASDQLEWNVDCDLETVLEDDLEIDLKIELAPHVLHRGT